MNINSDEIDLKKLIIDLRKNKLIFLRCILITILFSSIIYFFLFSDQKKVNINFFPLKPSQVESFVSLEGIDTFTIRKIDKNGNFYYENTMNSNFLANEFARTILVKEVFEEIDFSEILPAKNIQDEGELKKTKLKFIKDINVSLLDEVNFKNKLYFYLEFNTAANDSEIQKFAKSLYEITNNKVREEILESLNKDLNSKLFERNFELESLLLEKKQLILEYNFKLNQELAFLKEQYAIAKRMDIKESFIVDLTSAASNIDSSRKFLEDNNSIPYFSRGYPSIDEEIKQKEGRLTKNIDLYVPGLFKVQSSILASENNIEIKKLEKLKGINFLKKGVFKSMNFSEALITISPKINIYLYSFFTLFFGLIFSFVIFLYKKITQ